TQGRAKPHGRARWRRQLPGQPDALGIEADRLVEFDKQWRGRDRRLRPVVDDRRGVGENELLGVEMVAFDQRHAAIALAPQSAPVPSPANSSHWPSSSVVTPSTAAFVAFEPASAPITT